MDGQAFFSSKLVTIMDDTEIFTNIIDVLKAGLTANGQGDVAVKQNYQPTNQGPNLGKTLYLDKLPGDKRYGYLKREDHWDEYEQVEVHTETQIYESTFQLTGLSIQDPKLGAAQKTASDLVNLAAAILQGDAGREALRIRGLNIYRIESIRNPQFVDDRDRFEASPSFDFTLQHEQVIISQSPVVEDISLDIERV